MIPAIKIRLWTIPLLLFLAGGFLVYAEGFEQETLTAPQQAAPAFQHLGMIKEIEVTAVLPDYPLISVSSYRGYTREKCITCHDGIEEVNDSHPREFGCAVCHGGDGNTVNKDQAHSTLIYDAGSNSGRRNPSALKVAGRSCGQAHCHSGHENKDRNHIERVRKSMMATLAGVISNLRFQWGGQSGKEAKYGVYKVIDQDSVVPRRWGALYELSALPFFTPIDLKAAQRSGIQTETQKVSYHIGDSLLREKCFQCHLGSPSAQDMNRSQGCAACHFTRAANGRYKGNDPTIDKNQSGHTAFHRMTALPEKSGCLQCHRNFFTKSSSEDLFSEYRQDENVIFPGRGQIKQDIHFKLGFECIDCHTQFDIMGDGNIYSKQFQAVEIRCETCHGTEESYPSIAQINFPDDRAVRLSRHYQGFVNQPGDWMVISARDRKMTNVKVLEGKIVTLEKRTGKRHVTPLVRDGNSAHFISGHKNLGCTACHTQWTPACNGCEVLYRQSGKPISNHESFQWAQSARTNTVTGPVLFMGPRGKIVTVSAQSPRFLTVLDEKDHLIEVISKDGDSMGSYKEWRFTNPMGFSGSGAGFAFQSHSVGTKVRPCTGCHLSSTTLGLDEGEIKIGKSLSGRGDKMEPLVRTNMVSGNSDLGPQAIVTLRGEQIAGSGQTGARPLNQKEITRALRVGNCISCHDSYDDPIYKNIRQSYKFEKSIDHRILRDNILKAN